MWRGNETELRVNANQLFLGLVGTVLWIYSLSQNDWVNADTLKGGLFSLQVAVPCRELYTNTTMVSASASGTWGSVCNHILNDTNRMQCDLVHEILKPDLVEFFSANIKRYRDMCAGTDAHVQVGYLLIAGTVFSLVALIIGTSFLLRENLVTKHVAILPSAFYLLSAFLGCVAVLHWHYAFNDVFDQTGSGYILAVVGTIMLTLVAISMFTTGCFPGLCAVSGEPRPMAQQGFGLRFRRMWRWCARKCRRPTSGYRSHHDSIS
ncbi:hypothetical protein THRCLA_21499 [Thraustotheca clavata]|uniref:Transmembrane protein n=1 Tax=Thraustotheca clavata TaxID=74557 RepID=A0A1V9ZVV7_9STRA|nr:hypothetical protein THRCLA_21499 [Thraustotheca clavata]